MCVNCALCAAPSGEAWKCMCVECGGWSEGPWWWSLPCQAGAVPASTPPSPPRSPARTPEAPPVPPQPLASLRHRRGVYLSSTQTFHQHVPPSCWTFGNLTSAPLFDHVYQFGLASYRTRGQYSYSTQLIQSSID